MNAKKKILVVDDDKHFTKILKDWFTAKGMDVHVAHSGKDALDTFKKNSFDIVLLDALIPKMDGFKTCQEIRKLPTGKNVPVIMMSAIYKGAREADRAKAQCGATDYEVKPVNLMKLHEKVLQYLQN